MTTSSAVPTNLTKGFEAISGVYVLTGSAFCTPQVATITYAKSQVSNLPSQRIWIYEPPGQVRDSLDQRLLACHGGPPRLLVADPTVAARKHHGR